MSSFNQDPYRPVGDPTVTSTSETGERARAAADSIAGPAGDVKDTAVAAGKDVLETAKHEAGQVVGEAKTQGRRLLDESVGELRGQAETIQARLAGHRGLQHCSHQPPVRRMVIKHAPS